MKLQDWKREKGSIGKIIPALVFEWVKTGHWTLSEFKEWLNAYEKPTENFPMTETSKALDKISEMLERLHR